ncbi:hypothetical protein K491DRAFT_676308 [Lophiostoma macrostomum CBS 122681]|uniref:Uncharacterized protein n=1 Tax=Lophiostoma macrostomum CBS 122681 TaxID=1314788 RepID=A0A6A6TF18_9PLEO|nr:hypothetical protein K491DRAFT_676308 [Lophiostoma macrostomum CBS 122681]
MALYRAAAIFAGLQHSFVGPVSDIRRMAVSGATFCGAGWNGWGGSDMDSGDWGGREGTVCVYREGMQGLRMRWDEVLEGLRKECWWNEYKSRCVSRECVGFSLIPRSSSLFGVEYRGSRRRRHGPLGQGFKQGRAGPARLFRKNQEPATRPFPCRKSAVGSLYASYTDSLPVGARQKQQGDQRNGGAECFWTGWAGYPSKREVTSMRRPWMRTGVLGLFPGNGLRVWTSVGVWGCDGIVIVMHGGSALVRLTFVPDDVDGVSRQLNAARIGDETSQGRRVTIPQY